MTVSEANARLSGASVEAIRAHYDVGNDFFEAWLDPTMTYSAARWSHPQGNNQSLEDAQIAKLDWHLAHCSSKGGTLLDIGCGWGGLMARALEIEAANRCIGLTPSKNQSDWISERMGDLPIEVVSETWENARLSMKVDAICSVGAIEHFARPDLCTHERVELYRRFFDHCHQLLGPGRPMSLQFISWADIDREDIDKNLPKGLFPESALPFLSEVKDALRAYFEVVKQEDRPRDYSLTLAAWIARMTDQRSALIEQHGKGVFKAYSRAFRRFALGFEGGSLSLHRMHLVAI